MNTLRPALLAALLCASACKKQPPLPPETPEPLTQVEVPDEPATVEAPPAEPPKRDDRLDAEGLRKRINGLIPQLQGRDVAAHRAALTQLKELRERHPDAAIVHLNLGVAEHKLGNRDGARAAFERARELEPTLGHAHLYLGMLHEEAGDYAAAEALYRAGIAADPENGALPAGLVSVLRKQERYAQVLDEAQTALKVSATSPEVYNDVGLAYLAQGEFLLAKFMFRKGLGLAGGEQQAYLHANLGRALFEEDKLDEATFRLKKALELDPDFVPALVVLAQVYMKDRNYADTVDLLERAARQAPDDADVQVNLGVAYRGVERFDDARAAYQRALQLRPSDPAPHFNLGILHGDYLKDYDAALAAFATYKKAGGQESALADTYIEAVEREKRLVERRKEREDAAKRREAERAERKRLADEEAKRQAEAAAAGGGASSPQTQEGADESTPDGDPSTDPVTDPQEGE